MDGSDKLNDLRKSNKVGVPELRKIGAFREHPLLRGSSAWRQKVGAQEPAYCVYIIASL